MRLFFFVAEPPATVAGTSRYPRLTELTAGGMSTSSAVKMASKDLNLKKSDVYRVALNLQPSSVKKDDG